MDYIVKILEALVALAGYVAAIVAFSKGREWKGAATGMMQAVDAVKVADKGAANKVTAAITNVFAAKGLAGAFDSLVKTAGFNKGDGESPGRDGGPPGAGR